jgi:hypothetical protein
MAYPISTRYSGFTIQSRLTFFIAMPVSFQSEFCPNPDGTKKARSGLFPDRALLLYSILGTSMI